VPTKRRPWLWPLFALLGVGIVIGLGALLGYQTFKPVRIVGPSMAKAFLGKHGSLRCEKCQIDFVFDLEDVPMPDRLVCPFCGHVHRNGVGVKVMPGELVRIDRAALGESGPARFEVVAFDVPGEKRMLGVKRVVGLPGEHVAILDGDLIINGKTFCKDDQQWNAVRMLLNRHIESEQEHWLPESSSSSWRFERPNSGYAFNVALPDTVETQWVEYHHQRTQQSLGEKSGGILDDDSYNQSLSRQLNDVCDASFILSGRVKGTFALRGHDGWRDWIVDIDTDRRTATLLSAEKRISTSPLPTSAPNPLDPEGSLHQFELRLCDGWIRLFTDGALVLEHKIEPGDGPRVASSKPFAFGASQGEMGISPWIAIYRDIYYLDPVGLPQSWKMDRPLGPDEYFLLGDNVPVSTDSRHFGPVKRSAIRGIVKKLE
jgi:type IV secretory pathway protease TraF